MKYPGGKNHGSSYPRIINQIPPHHTFVEPFAGSAAIRRLMKPSARTVLIDLDAAVLGRLAELVPDAVLLNVDGLEWLEAEGSVFQNQSTVIYCDPPYVASACASPLRYEHVLSDEQHERPTWPHSAASCELATPWTARTSHTGRSATRSKPSPAGRTRAIGSLTAFATPE